MQAFDNVLDKSGHDVVKSSKKAMGDEDTE